MRDLDVELPQWWSDRIQAAWDRAREAALAAWQVRREYSAPIDPAIAELAIAFGHGARSAFPYLTTWDAVRPQLRADWIRLGHVGPAAWDQIAELVRNEWLRAAGPSGDAAPEPDLRHEP
jgi:hypothetical protein